MKDVGIFIRSFDGDAKWLKRTLPLLIERAHGYSDIVVVGIEAECFAVQSIADANGVRFADDGAAEFIPNGYINQQFSKLRADYFLDTKYIFYVDSDVACLREHTPDILFDGELPIMLYSEWDHVGGRVGGGDACCWFEPTKKALGFDPAYEFMRKLPLIYPRSVITGCREYIERRHNTTLAKYLNRADSFSEFNAIGAYAYQHHKEKFKWVCPETEGIPDNPFQQFWSHGDLDEQLETIGA